MSTHGLIEISLSGLDGETARLVTNLFDRWGQGGTVVEQAVGGDAGSTVKTYLLPEDDHNLRQIEIGLELLKRARSSSAPHDPPYRQELSEPHIRFLAETDWAEAWKTHYDVLRVGRRLVVKPTWRDYVPQMDDLLIALDPGMAFGSGLHPTTRLCLEALEDHLQPGASVLDLGTGSGILAIAAARLGASRVLALDTDPLAVRVARENVALNRVESTVQVEVGTVEIPIPESASQQVSDSVNSHLQSPTWNLVAANILAETISRMAPALAASLVPCGTLIASGIIADQASGVIARLDENELSLIEQRADDDWVALIARKTTR